MLTHEIVAAAAHSINGTNVENCSLNRRVAVGVKNGGVDDTDAWVILDFSDGTARLREVRHCGPLSDADSALDVALVIFAESSVWRQFGEGGFDSVIAAADARNVVVTGKLAYFIRHVRSSVDLMVLFGRLFVRYSL